MILVMFDYWMAEILCFACQLLSKMVHWGIYLLVLG